MTEKYLLFDPGDGGDEVLLRYGEYQIENPDDICGDHLHLYQVEGHFTWRDLAALANKLMLMEEPKISAMSAAGAQRSGKIRKATKADLERYGVPNGE